MLLAGDIGGTKTNLAIYADGNLHQPLAEATFPSANYPSLEAVVQAFLSQTQLAVDRASFGVAGPVIEGRATVTNLPWMMDEQQMAHSLQLKSVRLLNDLAAIASAVPFLPPQSLHTLRAGQAVPAGPIAIIAPGTGLGEAYLTWDGTRYRPHPSEGGHADFAPTNEMELGLLRFLLQKYDHVSYERVCSGKGIPNLYEYLRYRGFAEEPAWLKDQLAAAPDPSPIIVNNALANKSELCVAALDLFVAILGAQAGNLALTILSTGGVYLGGGIPPRILPILKSGRFMEIFSMKGRFMKLLDQMPIHVILDPKAALFGAACNVMT